MTNEELIELAFKARENAYAPYSHWKVGAALLCTNGKVYLGCNIESSSFTPTCCAERTAIFTAVSQGDKDFEKIAVVGGDEKMGPNGICTPCGVCRQVMAEFCDPDKFHIICAQSKEKYEDYTLRQMIPECNFTATNNGYGFKANK